MNTSIRYTLAAIATGSVVLFGSAQASAYDHVNASYDFIYNAVVNDATVPPDGCNIDWGTWEGHTKGACYLSEVFKHGNNYTDECVHDLWTIQTSSPTSEEYYDLIASSPALGGVAPVPETYFRRVTAIGQVQSGDVIVIDKVTGVNAYAGHTMIVRGSAIQISLSPVYSGTLQWAVPIMDATSTAHGCSGTYKDSRWVGACNGGYMDDGAGFAWIRIYTDIITGNMIGYSWSATSGSPYYSQNPASSVYRPYLVGRFTSLPVCEDPIDPPPP